jgi:type VI secretion system protein ImpF
MMRSEPDFTVTMPVLDRLVDKDPQSRAEDALTRAESVRQIKAGLRRDLEWLLNTRRISVEPDESLKGLNRSVYVYGLPDFSSYTASSPKDQAKLIRAILNTLKIFEPRLANLQVTPADDGQRPRLQSLRLRIDGLLLMDPAPEHVSFDTVIELRSGECQVMGEMDAG